MGFFEFVVSDAFLVPSLLPVGFWAVSVGRTSVTGARLLWRAVTRHLSGRWGGDWILAQRVVGWLALGWLRLGCDVRRFNSTTIPFRPIRFGVSQTA